jgi:hypothetical protein
MSKCTENPILFINMLDYESHLKLYSEGTNMGIETKIKNTQIKMYMRNQS